jgi:hypothetical protein
MLLRSNRKYKLKFLNRFILPIEFSSSNHDIQECEGTRLISAFCFFSIVAVVEASHRFIQL